MKTADRIVIAQPQVVDGDEAAAKTEDVPLPVGEIDELVRTLEGLQAAARYEFNVRARPRLRKLSLLDLPDELLLEIFDCFKGWVDSDQEFYHINLEVDTRSIQNSRLTCRRLCDISSHLLVPCVYVIPTLSSLEFLKQVTSHPKISRGTRVFRIDASFYGARIANDIRRFAVLCSRKVREDIQHLEREIRDWGDDDDDSCDDDASEVHGPDPCKPISNHTAACSLLGTHSGPANMSPTIHSSMRQPSLFSRAMNAIVSSSSSKKKS